MGLMLVGLAMRRKIGLLLVGLAMGRIMELVLVGLATGRFTAGVTCPQERSWRVHNRASRGPPTAH